MKEQRK
jgi:hypothetical protein